MLYEDMERWAFVEKVLLKFVEDRKSRENTIKNSKDPDYIIKEKPFQSYKNFNRSTK